MNIVSIECPHCSTALKISPEMRGTAVQCPDCKGKMLVPELTPVPSTLVVSGGEVLSRTCPGCENPFGVTKEMLGTRVLCPHCGFAVELLRPDSPVIKNPSLLDANIEQETVDVRERFRGYRPPKQQPGQVPLKHSQTPRPIQPLKGVRPFDSSPPKPEPIPEISPKSAEAIAADAPAEPPRILLNSPSVRSKALDPQETLEIEVDRISNNSQQDADSDDLALRELARPSSSVVHELDVSHLLPPKFHTNDPSMIRVRKSRFDESFVLLPDSAGGFQRVNNTIIRVEHDGEMITLCTPDKQQRIRRRLLINVVALIVCVTILYVAFRLLIR